MQTEDILAEVPSYWRHYTEQSASDAPSLDPKRSRGGIHELELAIDRMDAVYNDRSEVLPVNVANNGTVPGSTTRWSSRRWGCATRRGSTSCPCRASEARAWVGRVTRPVPQAAADAAWNGDHRQAMRALPPHPLVRSLDVADGLYREMAHAHRDHLTQRLVPT